MSARALATDYASVRRYDADGRLSARANISKACVSPYYGREIPGWQALGLEPSRVYRLYRDPEELARAASSFNGLPLLDEHKPTSADDHPYDNVVGALGTEAVFEFPFLTNSLVVWTSDAIAAIENGTQRELSCGYSYTPDMTRGVTPDGERYDGIMRDIRGNHVSLVREGRCGSSCIVGDAAHYIARDIATIFKTRKTK